MEKIIETLENFRDNIMCDIRADWAEESEKILWLEQWRKIDSAIMLLRSVGDNANTPI